MINKALLAGAAVLMTAQAVSAQTGTQSMPSMEEMWRIIQAQQAEIAALKEQAQKTDAKLEQTEEMVTATADAVESGAAGSASLAKVASWVEKTKIGGYGEHHFNRFDDKDDMVDAHRFVLYVGHEFSDDVRFFSELELEHGLVEGGDDSPGEVELEQAYIEWDFAANHSVQLGQFLLPVGILNETHEPETFYGTERNQVEAKIIPTTWWESGAMFKGDLAPGLSYNLAVHSGLDTDNANIRSGRQKSAKAVANDWAYTARLKYTGIAGLELAGSLQYQENISQGTLSDASAWLTEIHAAYSTGPFALRALWAEWDIDGAEAELLGRDKQDGWYLEPSYKITDKLGAFVRYSEYNNQAGFSRVGDTELWEYGINYWLVPNVVLKADITDYVSDNSGTDNDALNLGLGWSF